MTTVEVAESKWPTKGHNADQMEAAITGIVARERSDYDELTVRCGLCDWTCTGENRDTTVAAAEHRETMHQTEWETFRKRRKRLTSSVAEQWPKHRVLARLQQWAEEHDGKAPTQADWSGKSSDDHPNWAHVHALFGTWGRGLEMAGLTRTKGGGVQAGNGKPRIGIPDEQVLDWIRAFVAEHGHRPGPADLGGEDMLSESGLKKRFGGTKEAWRLAGVEDAPRRPPAAETSKSPAELVSGLPPTPPILQAVRDGMADVAKEEFLPGFPVLRSSEEAQAAPHDVVIALARIEGISRVLPFDKSEALREINIIAFEALGLEESAA